MAPWAKNDTALAPSMQSLLGGQGVGSPLRLGDLRFLCRPVAKRLPPRSQWTVTRSAVHVADGLLQADHNRPGDMLWPI